MLVVEQTLLVRHSRGVSGKRARGTKRNSNRESTVCVQVERRTSDAHRLDIVNWPALFSPCNCVDETYNEFVASCRFLIEIFIPLPTPPSTMFTLSQTISRFEAFLKDDRTDHEVTSKRLKTEGIRTHSSSPFHLRSSIQSTSITLSKH